MRAHTVRDLRVAGIIAMVFCLAACHLPERNPARMQQRTEVPLSPAPGAEVPGSSQAATLWPDRQWWRQWHDPQLDTLIERALAAAPDLQQAQARLATALRNIEQQRAELGIDIKAVAQAARTGLSKNFSLPGSTQQAGQAVPPSVVALGFAGLQFQYDFDWWGQRRAAVDGAIDRARASAADRAAAALLLQNAVADSYCGWLADRQRLQIAQRLVAVQENLLRLSQRRRAQGLDASDTEHQARADLAQARLQSAALSGSAQLRLVQLAALLGVAPDQLPALQARPLPVIGAVLPPDAGLELLGRRPDIVASRWRIEAAGTDVLQARAAYLPDISISALAVFISSDFHKLFQRDSVLWNVGPALTLPVFESGRIQARYGVSRAQLDSAIADYNQTVVNAARDVGTQVALLRQLGAQRAQWGVAVAETTALSNRTTRLARQGLADQRARDSSEAQLLRARDAALQTDAQWLSAQLALIKALGGGFEDEASASVDLVGGEHTPARPEPKAMRSAAHD